MLALLRLAATVGAAANWLVIFIAVIITVFTLYVGIAMGATLRAIDPEQRALRYAVFRDLLRCFRDWWRR
jgi:hypothetical protein